MQHYKMAQRNSLFVLIAILIVGLLALISSDLQIAFIQAAVSASTGSNSSSSQSGTAIVALSPDGNTLARVDRGTQITIWDLATGKQKLTFSSHNGVAFTGLAFSPDGNTLASVSDTIDLWDMVSGQERVLSGPGSAIIDLAFSPDGRTLAGIGNDEQILIWNLETASLPTVLRTGHSDAIAATVFSPEGTLLASGSKDTQVKLWAIPLAGQEPRTTLQTGLAVTSLAFSPDSKFLASLLASTGGDNRIMLWDPNTGTATGMLTGQSGDTISNFTFSPNGSLLATGGNSVTTSGNNAQIQLWDVASAKKSSTLESPSDAAVIAVAFSPEANTLVSVGANGQIIAWDLSKSELRQSFNGQGPVTKAVFSTNQQTLANLGPDGQVTLWRLAADGQQLKVQPVSLPSSSSSDPGGSDPQNSGSNNAVQQTAAPASATQPTAQAAAQPPNTISADPKPSPRNWKGITALAISADGTFLGTARAGDSTVKLYNPSTGSKLSTLSPIATNTIISGLAFAGTSKDLLSGSRDTIVRRWDTATGKQNQTFQGPEHPIRAIAASPDGQLVASAGEETRIMLWNAGNGQLNRILSGIHIDFVNSLAFSADGKQLASGGADARVVLWDPATGKPLKTLLGHSGEVNAVAFSKDGHWLASASADSSVRLWDAVTGQQIYRLMGHQAAVRTLAFSPDGQTLATGGEDSKILIWDTKTGKLLQSLTGSKNFINVLVFDPANSSYLYAGDEASQLSRWSLTTGNQPAGNQPTWTVTVPLESAQASTLMFPTNTRLSDAHAVRSDPADSSAVSAAGSTLLKGLLNWLFPAANAAIPPAPGGPILVITSPTATYGQYYPEILRTEGLNAFNVADISTVSASTLANYDVVILAPASLTTAQVNMFTTWVSGGGNLIAMRPDSQLASLLGLTAAGSTLSNAYMLVDNSTRPGNGIVNQTIQFHGTADRYTLSGASSIATLYTDATTATNPANPAVTLRSVGSGQAAAFTYDLATSIVYSRQGNPAWAAQERDGFSPIRPDDKFYGAATGDPQPDWVDLNHEVAVPQADEQQRLFANLILQMDLAKKPLPRFWYFPFGKKAVVIMTGDDHGNGGTAGRFDQYIASSPSGCNVANWECIRSTSYIYTGTPFPQQTPPTYYTDRGFEVGLHINTNCADFTPSSLDTFYSQQVSGFTSAYPNIPAPITQRHHCIAWSDWLTAAKTELKYGMRLDTSYYFWPPSWVQNRPGLFTSSAMPMRFADLDGTLIDVYNVVTQMTDESGQDYPFTSDALLSAAVGPQGYYGAYTVNAHTDTVSNPVSDGVLASALPRNVPIVSSVQMLNWLDARNSSSFGSISWNGTNALSFNVTTGSGANGLKAMVPTHFTNNVLTGITGPGGAVTFTTDTIKGIEYAFFSAAAESYTANYAVDSTAPTVTATSPTNGATGVSQGTVVTATFSEAMDPTTITTSTFTLQNGSNTVPAKVTYNAATHTATLTPSSSLAASTAYTASLTAGVKDLAGNALAAKSWSFTTEAQPCASVPCSAWSSSTTPGTPSVNDPNAVELGVKFKVDLNGFITGIRFYQVNAGTYTGNLWSLGGQQLATGTVTATAPGWQQVNFAPVAVTANTVYVASYYAPNGNYAGDNNFFANAGVDNGPVHLLKDNDPVGGPDGVYRYGSSGFPTDTYLSSNYWVDVVFTTSIAPDTTPPTVTMTAPANGATVAGTAVTVSANASDNVGVTSVQFLLDGAALGSPDTTSPYSITWDTTTATNGAHTLSARASDAAGNTATATAVTVTVSNGTNTGGFLAPSANTPVTSSAGDNNGFEVNPTNAYALESPPQFAVDTNSGTNTNTSCTNNGKDKHIYYNYSFGNNGGGLPSGATIKGIEVRLDAKVDSTTGSPKMCVQLSWDGGNTWTAAKSTATLTTAEATYLLGGAADTWGRTWAGGNFSNANFRVRIINVASSTARTFSLDWVAVRVTYQ